MGVRASGNGWWHCLNDTISVFWEEASEIFIRFSKVPVPRMGLNCGLYSFSPFLRASLHLRGCEGILRASLHLSFPTCRCGAGGGQATTGVLAVRGKGCSGPSGQSCPTWGHLPLWPSPGLSGTFLHLALQVFHLESVCLGRKTPPSPDFILLNWIKHKDELCLVLCIY